MSATKLGFLVLAVIGLVLAPATPTVGTHDGMPSPPTAEECTTLTDGEILLTSTGPRPGCITVEPGDRIQWTHQDPLAFHDPGDGHPGQDFSLCFAAHHYAGAVEDSASDQAMAHGETFGAELGFDGDDIVLRNVTFDGVHMEDERRCTPEEDPRDVWQPTEDGDVALRYVCYQHVEQGDGWIVLDTPDG